MRKLRQWILFLLISCFAAVPAHAMDRGFQQLSDVGLTEEFEELVPELIQKSNGSLADWGLAPLSEDEVDLDAFYPYYYLDDPFSMNIQTASDFHAVIDTNPYLWYHDFEQDGKYVQLAADLGRPLDKDAKKSLSEEQISKIEANVGKWNYNSTGWGDTSMDLKEKAIALGASGDRITLIGCFHGLMFAVCTEGDEITEVIALTDRSFPIYKPNLEEVAQRGGFRTIGGDSLDIRAGDSYSYEALQQSLGQLEMTPVTGEYALRGHSVALAFLGNRRVLIALGGGALTAVLFGCHFYLNRNKKD